MAVLQTAATSASLVASRRLQDSPCASPGLVYSASGKLAEALRDVVAACPDPVAVEEALTSSVASLAHDASVVKACSTADGSRVAGEAVLHNSQSGLLSSFSLDLLERILRRIPELSFEEKGYTSLAHTSLACKATWAAYSRFAACFKLEWRIEKFSSIVSADAIFSPTAGAVVCLGRRWEIRVDPKGDGGGSGTHVSVFLCGKPVQEGAADAVRCSAKAEVWVGETLAFTASFQNSPFPTGSGGWGWPKAVVLTEFTRLLALKPASAVVIKWWVHGAYGV